MSFLGQKALMKKSKPTVLSINRNTVVDQVASFLYSTGAVSSSKEITDIKFGNCSEELVKLEIYTRKEVQRKN